MLRLQVVSSLNGAVNIGARVFFFRSVQVKKFYFVLTLLVCFLLLPVAVLVDPVMNWWERRQKNVNH